MGMCKDLGNILQISSIALKCMRSFSKTHSVFAQENGGLEMELILNNDPLLLLNLKRQPEHGRHKRLLEILIRMRSYLFRGVVAE